jgi:predicted secreted protein
MPRPIVRLMLVGLVALAPRAALAADGAAVGTEINLTQTATRTVTPDTLGATLRIELRGADGRAIQADLNRRMAEALELAKSSPAVRARTGAYSVTRDFGVKNREAWQASETVTLTAKDFAAVLSLAGKMQDKGMLMSGMEFSLAPETLAAAQSDLTSAALDALRARAQDVAKDLGLTVARYASVTVGNVEQNARPLPMARLMSSADMPPPEAQAGDATLSLTATAVVVLAPPKP